MKICFPLERSICPIWDSGPLAWVCLSIWPGPRAYYKQQKDCQIIALMTSMKEQCFTPLMDERCIICLNKDKQEPQSILKGYKEEYWQLYEQEELLMQHEVWPKYQKCHYCDFEESGFRDWSAANPFGPHLGQLLQQPSKGSIRSF